MRITIPLFFLILLASCKRYQYATVSSTNLTIDDSKQFVAENDTLRLVYNFHGEDAPIYLTIENKLNVPVFINWQQSSLIVNDKAISYKPKNLYVAGDIYTYRPSRTSYTVDAIDATIALPENSDFIPPHSFITKNPMGLTNQVIKDLPGSTKFHREEMLSVDGEYYSIKKASFTETNSPIRFRSYLTVTVGEATSKPVFYEHIFYVSELITTDLGPQHFGDSFRNRGNRYFVQESTGYGRTMTGFGVIAGTAVVAGAAAALNPNYKCNNDGY